MLASKQELFFTKQKRCKNNKHQQKKLNNIKDKKEIKFI